MSADYQPPACAGQWGLFDSKDPADHAQAAAICATCPVQATCADTATQVRAAAAYPSLMQGTWAGGLYGRTGHTPGTTVRTCSSCHHYMPRIREDRLPAGAVLHASGGLCVDCHPGYARTA